MERLANGGCPTEKLAGRVPTSENLLITVRGASEAEVVTIRGLANKVFSSLESKIKPGIGVISEKLGTGLKSLSPSVAMIGFDLVHEAAEMRSAAQRASSDWPSESVIDAQRRAGYEFTPSEGKPAWTYNPDFWARLDMRAYAIVKMVTDPTYLAGQLPRSTWDPHYIDPNGLY